MLHNIKVSGFSYRLRPVELRDAQFIIDVRLENEDKSKYVHRISSDVELQKEWLLSYFEKHNDYYFVIENLFTNEPEGLISIYNIEGNIAEWGRWVLKSGSLSAIESVSLIYKVAFEKLCLQEVYTHTVEDNVSVVAFHETLGAKFRMVIPGEFKLGESVYNAVEQYVDSDYYYSNIARLLRDKCLKLFTRNCKNSIGMFKFHHYGVATESITAYLDNYSGYAAEDEFTDPLQGVRGLFIITNSNERLELLENLSDSNVLTPYFSNSDRIYHAGFYVKNIDEALKFLVDKLKAKVVSEPKLSIFFKENICFLMLKNKFIIELLQVQKNIY